MLTYERADHRCLNASQGLNESNKPLQLNHWTSVYQPIQAWCRMQVSVNSVIIGLDNCLLPVRPLSEAMLRADSMLSPSQWETSSQSNAVSHWRSANLESTLNAGVVLFGKKCYQQNQRTCIQRNGFENVIAKWLQFCLSHYMLKGERCRTCSHGSHHHVAAYLGSTKTRNNVLLLRN